MSPAEAKRKRRIRIAAIVIGALIVIALVLPRLVNVNSFRPKLEAELSTALGRQVTVGNLDLSIFSGSVSADNISVGDDPAFGKEPFVTAKSFKAGVEIMPLIFSKTLHITGVTLDEPQITLLRGPGGKWNFSTIGGGSAAPPTPKEATSGESSGGSLAVDKVSIDNGRLLVGTAGSAEKPQVYDKVNLEVTNFSATTAFPFEVTAALPGGGDLSLKGKCGPMNTANTGQTPFEASLTVRSLDLAASGFAAPASGIQGMVEIEAAVNSDGKEAKANGSLKAEKLKLAAKGAPSKPAVAAKYALSHNFTTDSGVLTQFEVSIGKAVMRVTGSYQMPEQATTLSLKANATDMPLDEISAALPAVGVVMPTGVQLQGGSLSADLAISGPTDRLVISGPIRMSNAKLAGLDLNAKLSAIPGLAGKHSGGKDTTIQNLSTTVSAAPDGVQASAMNLTIAGLGVVTGAGTVAPSSALNFNMNATLGDRGASVPFAIQGTTSDPKFVPDVKGMATKAISNKVSESLAPKSAGKRRR